MRIFKFIPALVLVTAFISCDTAPVVSENRVYDFTTNGFLDEHHFQVTASAKPEQSIKGLVAQRENALIRARNELQIKAVQSLVNYRFSIYLKANNFYSETACPDSAVIKNILQDKVISFINHGRIIDEFYEKDNTACIVYRIEMNNLKSSLDSLQVSLAKTESTKDN